MGLLDLPSSLFAVIDSLIGFVPALARLAFWALLSAAGTMWLYRQTSRQDELSELKPKIKAVQKKLASYDGPMDGLWPLIGESMKLSGRQMGMTLWPALVASLPVLFVLVFLSNNYGHRFPAAGEPVAVTPAPAEVDDASQWRFDGDARLTWSSDEATWTLPWPPAEGRITAPDYGPVLALPTARPVSVVHDKQWWNWLIGNPGGYLADDAPVEALEIGLPRQRFLAFGPDWLGYWEIPYLFLLVAFSLTIKIRFGIH